MGMFGNPDFKIWAIEHNYLITLKTPLSRALSTVVHCNVHYYGYANFLKILELVIIMFDIIVMHISVVVSAPGTRA